MGRGLEAHLVEALEQDRGRRDAQSRRGAQAGGRRDAQRQAHLKLAELADHSEKFSLMAG